MTVATSGIGLGLKWTPRFCKSDDPYEGINWVKREALVQRMDGSIVFQQKDVELPDTWTELALSQVTQKYFRGKLNKDGTPAEGRETSVRQVVDRVVDTIAEWAGFSFIEGEFNAQPLIDKGWKTVKSKDFLGYYAHKRPKQSVQRDIEVYFDSHASWLAWKNDLKWLMIHQHAAFNSPVWFNVGVVDYPQAAACFLVDVEDWILADDEEVLPEDALAHHGIAASQTKEILIFTNGSGSGINLSKIRSMDEWLKGGGQPSGPESFARGLDKWAEAIKSGGKTRRAAKMLILDADHPDIEHFTDIKAKEGRIAKYLMDGPFTKDMEGEALSHVFHQNSNLSTRVSNQFMEAVDERGMWPLISRSHHHLEHLPLGTSTISGTQGRVMQEIRAYDLMKRTADRAWECGCPGILFDTEINRWNTCLDEERITTCNPCAEYHFLTETSCNLASLNLKRFLIIDRDSEGKIIHRSFDVDQFTAAAEAVSTAMEVLVSNSRYPTSNIRDRTARYRSLGIGFANLGGMLMELSIPYDSSEGRAMAASITSLLTARTYYQSAQIASVLGPFEAFEENRESCTRVMKQHLEAAQAISLVEGLPDWVADAKEKSVGFWHGVVSSCENEGLRNAQASVLAPTGTIAFLMDCETTGIEPELALVKWKTLAGGGTLPIFTHIDGYLRNLGYEDEDIAKIHEHLQQGLSIRKCEVLKPEHAEVFRTSFKPADGDDFFLPWTAHVEMMAACQPFISGAISKTVNLPESATPEDIMGIYMEAWHSGLKAISIYRDNSKPLQAVATRPQADGSVVEEDSERMAELESQIAVLEEQLEAIVSKAGRRKMPVRLPALRTKFDIDGNKGYMHVGFYPDTWEIGEVFIKWTTQGSTISGFMDTCCKMASQLFQYGMSMEEFLEGYSWTQYPPFGPIMEDSDVRQCTSPTDYLAKKIAATASRVRDAQSFLESVGAVVVDAPLEKAPVTSTIPDNTRIGESCPQCGMSPIMVTQGCKKCYNPACGYDEGGCFG